MTSTPLNLHPVAGSGLGPLELVVVILLGLGVVASVRVALPGEWLVVVRRGRIVRATTGPVTMILPGPEQSRRWPSTSIEVPVLARATTRDGVTVRAVATCEIAVQSPVIGAPYVDPRAEARDVIETALAALIADRVVSDLTDPPLGMAAALALIDLPGGRVLSVEVEAVDALLGPPGTCRR